jgi:preprotein translocase subunit SecE
MKDSTATKPTAPRLRLMSEVIAEIKKVTWLSRREIINLTIIVLVITVVVALIIGGIDYGFSYLIQYFING